MPAISQSNLLQALGWALINSLWQMALLWVVYQLMLGFSSSMKSSRKVNYATGLLIIGFAWFILTFLNAFVGGSGGNPISSIAGGVVNENTWNNWSRKILPLASILYLVILVIPAWKFIRNYRFVQIIRKNGIHKIDAEWRMFVQRLAANMGIKRKVTIWLSELVQSPVTIGYLKPVILIPVAAINNLSTQQVEAILLHELSHIRRADYFFNLVINIIRSILYFNPFVKAFVHIIEREREISCDQMVMQFQYRPHDYASALLSLQRSPVPAYQMILAATGNNNLLKRVEAILGINTRDKFSVRRLIGAIFILVCMCSMNAVMFINAQKDAYSFQGFAESANPYHFLMSNDEQILKEDATKVVPFTVILKKKPATAPMQEIQIEEFVEPEIGQTIYPPYFYNVSNQTEILPDLAEEDEAKLKGTLQATRKILEEKEWKELEKSYAEVLNSQEKLALKGHYIAELNNYDWNKLETQLRLSYNQLDWQKINEQVCTSLAAIKLDSLKTLVSTTLTDLNKMEIWLKENNITAIPDTDITLQVIKENQQQARLQLDRVKAIKAKKIVKL